MGAKPKFGIPENAYTSRAQCNIERSTRSRLARGWTDWLNEKSTESFTYSFWLTPRTANTVEDRGDRITFTEMTEVLETDSKIHRLEKVEDWQLKDGRWTRAMDQVQVTILKRTGTPNIREERHADGRLFHWEASTRGAKIVKNLLNPEILNTPTQQVGLLRTTCRH